MPSPSYLKQHPNGKYYVHWTEGRVGKRVSTGTSEMAAAEVFFATWMMQKQRADDAAAKAADPTLAEIWSAYHAGHAAQKVVTARRAASAWKKTLEPFFGALRVSVLTQGKIDEYVQKRTTGKLGPAVKPQSVTRELTNLLAAIKFCADRKRKLIDPSLVQRFDLPGQGEPRERWLRTEEIQRLLDAAAERRIDGRLSRVERFIWLALETAGREQAILDLTWDRVDFEVGVIVLDVPGRRKTKKRRATVPISTALRPILKRAFDERLNKDRFDGLVLDNKHSTWTGLQIAAARAGLGESRPTPKGRKPRATGISPNVLRHTAATHMARAGVSLWQIAKILGNSVAMVEKVYAKHVPADTLTAVDKISAGMLTAAE